MEAEEKLREQIKDRLSGYGCPDTYLKNEIKCWVNIFKEAGWMHIEPVQKVDCRYRSNGRCLEEQMYENSGELNPKNGVFISCSEENVQHGSCPYREFVSYQLAPVQLEVLGDEEIGFIVHDTYFMARDRGESTTESEHGCFVALSQATITKNEKKFGGLYRRKE